MARDMIDKTSTKTAKMGFLTPRRDRPKVWKSLWKTLWKTL